MYNKIGSHCLYQIPSDMIRQFWNMPSHLSIGPSIPYNLSLWSNLWWGTVSNALEKSIIIRSVWFWCSNELARSWMVWMSWVSHECRALNPCWHCQNSVTFSISRTNLTHSDLRATKLGLANQWEFSLLVCKKNYELLGLARRAWFSVVWAGLQQTDLARRNTALYRVSQKSLYPPNEIYFSIYKYILNTFNYDLNRPIS